ncbi:hypothetical protein LTR56_009612 [Elasticomyces elasticus]|nr:hypothetical protein LTR22_024287 [Elasticomyces elasticus]KAK3644673.1 hypothetical protein LTR56_009612 [Elasticomyces elasticus]KAK4906181.1 hypothetical protein LTR49_024624 [Elasticomyces elasticus]KAK5744088.1 hypothetical protein LTS12_023622 [Elasticomyces elasticus]
MAPTADNPPLSDTETAEKPVREQLKKASIAGLPQENLPKDTADMPIADERRSENGGRGRLQRKRSFEEVEGEESNHSATEATKLHMHTRKRSRDSTIDEVELSNGRKVSGERARDAADTVSIAADVTGDSSAPSERPGTPVQSGDKHIEAVVETIASPRTKRSRLHSTTADGEAVALAAPSMPETATEKAAPADSTADKPEVAEVSATKVPPTSGFANSSATSPFGALAGSKSPLAELPQTSSSAFKSSGFGSLAGSTSSGFGTIGKSIGGFGAGGGFASKSATADSSKENEKPNETSASTFGGALGQKSAFAAASAASTGFGSAATSGFGSLAGGFASPLGAGTGGGSPFGGTASGGLSTFASGAKSPLSLGSSSKSATAKPFGAPANDEEQGDEAADEDDPSGAKSPGTLSHDEEKQDDRFYAQSLETGEEDEITEYSCRAKVYNFATTTLENGKTKKEWRERGLGMLRFNVNREDEVPRARFLMRADGSHRVVLNTPVKKEIKFGAASGGPPQGGLMLFMGTIDGNSGLEMLQMKMKQQYALELYEKIVELQSEM